MAKDWVEIFSTQHAIEAEILKQKLESNSISVRLLNQQDSSYINFGAIYIYVDRDDVIKAKHILSKKSNEQSDH